MQNSAVSDLVGKVSSILLDPFISLVFAVSIIVFMYGVVEYIYNLNAGKGDDKAGKLHMAYGILGIFIMTAAWAIIKLVDATVGSNYVH